MVGNEEKSNGRSMNNVIVKIRIASAKDAASPTSKTQDGMGKIIIKITDISATANKIVGLNALFIDRFSMLYATGRLGIGAGSLYWQNADSYGHDGILSLR